MPTPLSPSAVFPTLVNRTSTQIGLAIVLALIAIAAGAVVASVSSGPPGSLLFGGSQATGVWVERSRPPLSRNSVAAAILVTPPSDGQLNFARRGHTATLLSDGNVLVSGGENSSGFVTTAEIFDPSSGNFTVSGNLSTPRADHTATRLSDGRVLIAGGRGALGPLNSTEIFDPGSGAFTAGPDLIGARSGHSATSFSDGKIVMIGGDASGSVEIYVPLLNAFALAVAKLGSPRAFHSAAVLSDRNILIVGGTTADSSPALSGEIFNVSSSTFSSVGNHTQDPHVRALLRLLPDGKVQIIGGTDHEDIEIYDPAINSFGAHAHVYPIGDSHPTLLQEILDSPTRAALFHLGASSILLNRTGQSITELAGSNRALVTGGVDSSGAFLNSAATLNTSAATITSDKLDYAPGTPVLVSGTGWQPNEAVTIMFHEDPHVATENPHAFTVQADANGDFVCQEYAPEELDNGITFILAAKGGSSGWTAQTAFTDSDPAPQPIPYSQNFSALPPGGAGSTTYPPGWQGWQLSTSGSSTSFRTSAATADLPLNASSSASTTTGGVHNYNGKIGILATGSSDPSLALAINTTGHSNVTISFDIMTVRNPFDGGSNTRINQVDLQYRVGTAGSFTSASGLTTGVYQNNTTTQTGAGVTTPQKLESKSLMLASAVDNQAVVQLRWVQRDVSGGGARPSFAVDNVAIGSSPAITSANAATFIIGNAGTFTATTTGSPTPTITKSGTLPSGVTFSENGDGTATLSGTPDAGSAGSYPLTIIASNGVLPDATQNFMLTVVNPGSLQFSAGNYDDPETNSGTHTRTITLQRTGGSDGAFDVTYATSDGNATLADNDYLASSGVLHWNDGDSADKTFTVTVKGDTTYEANETVNLTLSAPTGGATIVGINPATLTITNDDSAPSFSIADATHAEGNSGTTSFTFTVTRNGATDVTATVDFMTLNDSAVQPDDYTSNSGTLTFLAGDTSKPITVLVNGDTSFEADETFTVELSNATEATISDDEGLGTIQNDDSQPTVQFSSASSAGTESASPVNLEVTLSAASSQTVIVNYAVNGASTATDAGVDYTLLSGTLTLNPGDTSQNISLTVNDDSLDENDETLLVDLSAPGKATLGTPATHAYTIQDNDAAPIFTISDVTLAEGNSGTTDFIFTVTKTGPTALTAMVDYATANGTTSPATGGLTCGAGIDYESNSSSLSFGPGDATMIITIKVCGDVLSEPSETLYINLSNANNAAISDNQGVGTIVNDDNVTYNFEGFFAPIDNPPIVNAAKAGSAVPVKWRLTTAGAAPVSDPNSFVGLFSYQVNCGTTDGLEAAVETVAAGGSGLQYLGDGTWQINWKTLPNYPRGTCRVMDLQLNDGTHHYANFKFK